MTLGKQVIRIQELEFCLLFYFELTIIKGGLIVQKNIDEAMSAKQKNMRYFKIL